jgi:hypothetical protein
MAKVTYDENGEVVDYLAERNEEIKAHLEEVLEMFKAKEAANKNGKKNYGFMFSMQINNELNKYPKMAVEKFANIDADDISYYWNSYYDLMCYYNQFFEIVPNRQTFLRYIGLNARQYQQLQESEDEDIRSEIIFIEDALKGDAFRAGENGNSDAKAISFRMTARGADGHNIISASEDKLITEVAKRSPTEMFRQLDLITGGSGKLLK